MRPKIHPSSDRQLMRHLAWVLALKVAALYLLWQVFIAPWRMPVDTESMAGRLRPDTTQIKEIPRHDRPDRR